MRGGGGGGGQVIPPPDADSEETHKDRHCVTLTFSGDFSVDRESQVAFTGPKCPPSLRLKSVADGPWFTVLGGRVSAPPPLPPRPRGPDPLSPHPAGPPPPPPPRPRPPAAAAHGSAALPAPADVGGRQGGIAGGGLRFPGRRRGP